MFLMRSARKASGLSVISLAALLILAPSAVSPAAAVTLPSGFQESVVFSGLTQPTDVEFASDGRVFIAEKSGLIKVFDSLSDPTPTIFADFRTNTHNFVDRGMLGLALHPDFPATPYVYVLYTYDALPGGTAPTWGTFGGTSDTCPTPPGPFGGGCVVTGRLSRLTASGNVMTGTEQVLLTNWCQQFPSHSIGTISFGPDGALYVSGGDGATWDYVDYGQSGFPQVNPCGDPPGGVGGTQTPPTSEGGALRSQDIQTLNDITDPVSYGGTVIRIDPLTGAPLPDNPLAGGASVGDDPIIAYGLRNPLRIAMRPGTNEIWVGDVGWNTWEEIERIGNTTDTIIENFGWPCYEGIQPQPGYEGAGFNLCNNLYGEPGAATDPFFEYNHSQQVVPGEVCGVGSSSISGLTFYGTGSYPDVYNGALFFADYSRYCIWAMLLGPNGDPDPSTRLTFAGGASTPVDLKVGPGGDLFYVDISGGTIRRIRYIAVSQPPVAVIDTDRTNGPLALTVQFDASASFDPDPSDTVAYAWDLNGDGQFLDSTQVAPSFTYTIAGTYTVKLRVTDPQGATDTQTVTITAGNTAPTATIDPFVVTTWSAGDTINFSGSAIDGEDGSLAPAQLTWTLIIQHCPSNCHEHTMQSFEGVASGSFVTPDHDYPTHLELRLTATDSGGLTDTKSVSLYPNAVALTFDSNPPGLNLVVGSQSVPAPFTRTVIVNSANSVSAPSPQLVNGTSYTFASWSDGGAQSHNFTAPAATAAYTATYITSCAGCDDVNPCTLDGCNAQGVCIHVPLANGTSCSDSNVCNGTEVCQSGACATGTALNCSDGNSCTTDACTPQAGCSHTQIPGCVGAPVCGNNIVESGEQCDDGNTLSGDCCSATCQTAACDLTQLGTIVARVTAPLGLGSRDLEIIRDGDKPPLGTQSSSRQYDTWDGVNTSPDDWIGYVYTTPQTFTRVVFLEGLNWFDGGWFDSLTVQVRQNGSWNTVSGLVSTPPYPINDAISYSTYQLDFTPMTGDGIRIYGDPGGTADFISVAELEAWSGTTPPPAPTPTATATPLGSDVTALGTIIAKVTNPTGSGSRNLAIIRDGDFPPVGNQDSSRQYDTWDGANTSPDDWIGYTYATPSVFSRLVFQEGKHFWDGGWFDTLTVQVRQSGTWTSVSGLVSTPVYPASNNGVSYETYIFDFTPIAGDGIRIYGAPGGSADSISVGELRVYDTGPTPAPTP